VRHTFGPPQLIPRLSFRRDIFQICHHLLFFTLFLELERGLLKLLISLALLSFDKRVFKCMYFLLLSVPVIVSNF